MITVKNLEKHYHGRVVLNIDNLSIDNGTLLGVVGNNGAGKTTFLRLLLDLIRPDKGEIYSDDFMVFSTEKWKDYTGSYLDEGFLIDYLTPEEFFYFIGNTYGLNKQAVDAKLSAFSLFFNNEILGKKKKYIRDFSKGNKQKIGICSAIITDPSVLILDEPFNGLDPTSQILLKRMLADYNKKSGATIILSSHDLNHVTELTKRIAIIENGSIIRDILNDNTTLKELEHYFSIDKA